MCAALATFFDFLLLHFDFIKVGTVKSGYKTHYPYNQDD